MCAHSRNFSHIFQVVAVSAFIHQVFLKKECEELVEMQQKKSWEFVFTRLIEEKKHFSLIQIS